jgi:hypothetical protein
MRLHRQGIKSADLHRQRVAEQNKLADRQMAQKKHGMFIGSIIDWVKRAA